MWYGTPTTTFAEKYPSLYSYFDERVTIVRNRTSLQVYGMTIPERKAFFGDKNTYHKKGNTAICHFDNFALNDKAAWDNYYQGKGPRPTLATSPEDPMAIFLDALEQAAADPEVKNFVLDLSINTGGSSDVVMAMTSLMYDQSFFRAYNVITGQKMEWYYDVDRNFDGKYDALDQDVHYDLNFCIITSPISFSCGNLYPSLCKDAGLLIAGQKSGGGSCAVGAHRTAAGHPSVVFHHPLDHQGDPVAVPGMGHCPGPLCFLFQPLVFPKDGIYLSPVPYSFSASGQGGVLGKSYPCRPETHMSFLWTQRLLRGDRSGIGGEEQCAVMKLIRNRSSDICCGPLPPPISFSFCRHLFITETDRPDSWCWLP